LSARNTMPVIDLLDLKGLYTKTNPDLLAPNQLRVCRNTDFVRTYSAIGKIKGNRRVLNSIYQESSVTKSIPWVGFYKYSDLSGTILRHVLIAAGTTIRKVNDAGTTTSLATGIPENLTRVVDQFDRFMLIPNQNAFTMAQRARALKYDGERISNWGVDAPGAREVMIESYSSEVGWTSPEALTVESSIAWSGDGSLKQSYSTVVGVTTVSKQVPVFAVNTVMPDRMKVQLYISRLDYRRLETSGRTISFYVGSNGDLTTNYYRFDWRKGRLIPGWNTLFMDFSTFPSGEFGTVVGTPNDAALNVIGMELRPLILTDASVYWDSLVTLDQGAPVPSFAGGPAADVFSVDFNGSDEYMRSAVGTNLGAGANWSVSLWAKRTANTAGVIFEARVGVGPGVNNNKITIDYPSSQNDNIRISIFDVGGGVGNEKRYVLRKQFPINTWTNFVFTYNGTTLKGYVNGLEFPQADMAKQVDGAVGMTNTQQLVSIGSDATVAAGDRFFQGRVHSVAVWNAVLTAAGIEEAYNSGDAGSFVLSSSLGDYTQSANLVRWWRLGLNHNSIGFETVSAGAAFNLMTGAAEIDIEDVITDTPVSVTGDTATFAPGAEAFWSYKVTYVSENGLESNAGPESIEADNTVGSAGFSKIFLTGIPVSTDPQVTQRKLYRTLASGNEWLFLDVINDNTTTTYEDTTPDSSLGLVSPPEQGIVILDHSPPPYAGFCKVWKRTVFMGGDPLNPNLLYFSADDEPEAFPILNAFQLDDRVTGIYETDLGLLVTTETAHWRVVGDNPDYIVEKIRDGIGCVGPRACGTGRFIGWAGDRDGLRLYDLQTMLKISEVIRDKYDSIYKPFIEDMHTVHYRSKNALLQFNKNASGVYDKIFMYQYAFDDMGTGWYSEITIPGATGLNFLHFTEIEDANGDFHLYGGSSDGMLYEFFDANTHDWTSNNGALTPITMEIQTPYFRPGVTGAETEAGTGRVGARLIELRVDEKNLAETNWTVRFDYAHGSPDNGVVVDTETVPIRIPAGHAMQRYPADHGAVSIAEYIRLNLKNAELGKDVDLYGTRLYIHVQPGQYPVEPLIS
jgi:hypothetical protein